MKNVGLTGNIAAGKTTVARLLAAWGATVIDADAIVRDLERSGTKVFERIVATFGPEIVGPDGELDRAALRQRVFADRDALAALNANVHPAVAAERDKLMTGARARRAEIVVQDIPLLFEVMKPADFDAIILVDAPVAIRRERLAQTRGLDPDTADLMIAAQMPTEAKRTLATYVIDNDSTVELLEERTREVWRALLATP